MSCNHYKSMMRLIPPAIDGSSMHVDSSSHAGSSMQKQ
jgi:hypothetical protein